MNKIGMDGVESSASRAVSLAELSAALRTGVQAEAIDTEIGEVLVHGDDQVMTPWIRHYRTWEVEETAFIRSRLNANATFVDCGANFGWFSLIGSQLVGAGGSVVAVEPEPANLALLRANLWRCHADNVEVIPAAAGARRDVLTLQFDTSNRGNHQVHRVRADQGVSLLVPVVPLDEVLAGRRVDLVKIDVQGFDHEVFAGCGETISRNPNITFLIEFWPAGMVARGVDAAGVLSTYRSSGLDVSVLSSDGLPRPCDDSEVLAAVAEAETGFVNLVLERRS